MMLPDSTEVDLAEKDGSLDPSVHHVDHPELVAGIDSQDLPDGYFRSSFFIGTLLASGFSVSAVSLSLTHHTQSLITTRELEVLLSRHLCLGQSMLKSGRTPMWSGYHSR
jgi:hypothetical protein